VALLPPWEMIYRVVMVFMSRGDLTAHIYRPWGGLKHRDCPWREHEP